MKASMPYFHGAKCPYAHSMLTSSLSCLTMHRIARGAPGFRPPDPATWGSFGPCATPNGPQKDLETLGEDMKTQQKTCSWVARAVFTSMGTPSGKAIGNRTPACSSRRGNLGANPP